MTPEMVLFRVIRKTTAKTNNMKTLSLSNFHRCCPYHGWRRIHCGCRWCARGRWLDATGFVDEVFSVVDFLKLLLGSLLHVVTQRGNAVGMMLQGHLPISLFHLIIGG